MWFIGMDVHDKGTAVCILNETGMKIKAFKIYGSLCQVVEVIRKLSKQQSLAICYEASCGYGWLYRHLSPLAQKVQVANPGQVRLIFRCKRKTDRIDAEKLAKLLYLDTVPAIHVPSVDVQAWRGMIEHRRRIVAKRTSVKNALRALLRNAVIPALKGLWSRKGLAWLQEVVFEHPQDALRRDMLLADLGHHQQQIERVEAYLDAMADGHPAVVVLRTIPGIGPRTAEAVAAYIDDPRRFRNNRCIGAYFGMVPSEDSTGGVRRLGHITRQGPSAVRQLVTEATWQVIRRCPSMRAFYDRVARGDKNRRKIALVATAHKLLRAMLAMLQTGEAWRQAA